MEDTDTPTPTQSSRPTAPTRPSEETARLGDEIYERDIRAQVEGNHHGEYVAIDVSSGNWAIADDLLDAADRLRTECPDAIDVWLLRVGYRALHHFGPPGAQAAHSPSLSDSRLRRTTQLGVDAVRDLESVSVDDLAGLLARVEIPKG